MRRARFPVAFLALLALLNCQPKQTSNVPPATVADSKSAIALVGDLPLWTLTLGTLAFKESIPIGEKLVLLNQAQKATQAGKERDFVRVRRDSGSDGWVRADLVMSRAILAVVTTDNAVIYTAARNTAATTETIPRMTVVAIHSDTGGMSFIRVTCFNAATKVMLRGVALRNEGVSARPSDVQAAILLQMAAASKNPRQKRAFLATARTDYPDSHFLPELDAALNALDAPPTPPEPPAPAAPEESPPAPAP